MSSVDDNINKHFQHDVISSLTKTDVKKCLPAIETSQITGLDIALVAPRKCSFDAHVERRNRSRNDNPFSTPAKISIA